MNKNNQFKFSLHQEDVLLCEKSFDADVYDPFTRYSIDIRNELPKIISILQEVMSVKNYDVTYDFGEKKYDNLQMVKDFVKGANKYGYNMYKPSSKKFYNDNEMQRGVECKLGLYINDNTIVERVFHVEKFNPVVRYSVDLICTIDYIVDMLCKKFYEDDKKNIWDNYDLINKRGLNINQIRELPLSRRKNILNSI